MKGHRLRKAARGFVGACVERSRRVACSWHAHDGRKSTQVKRVRIQKHTRAKKGERHQTIIYENFTSFLCVRTHTTKAYKLCSRTWSPRCRLSSSSFGASSGGRQRRDSCRFALSLPTERECKKKNINNDVVHLHLIRDHSQLTFKRTFFREWERVG